MKNHILFFSFLFAAVSICNGQDTKFHYTVEVRNPVSDQSYVTLELNSFSEKNTTFCMPAWSPGTYEICHFGQWIDSLQAFDTNNAPLKVERKGSDEWVISNSKSLRRISYIAHDIPEDSLNTLPTTLSEMGSDFYFFNGPSVFGYLKNQKNQTYSVSYKLPAGWNVWCGLDQEAPLSFYAESYDRLIDCPVLAGGPRIKTFEFNQDSVLYTMVVNAESKVAMDSIIAFTRQCVEYQTGFFNEKPFRRYYFLFNFSSSNSRYGALEHLNSSAYFLPPPTRQTSIRNSFYTRVIAHEFFHVWNPKLNCPFELFNFNYQDSIRIKSMWFIEGVTEYYAKLTLTRTGILSSEQLYEDMKNIALSDTRDDLEYLSLRAAEIGVANTMYTKGALIAYFMDIEIRNKTDNKKSLDDVLFYINKEFGKKKKPYSDKKLIGLFRKAADIDLNNFYKKYVRGKEPLPVSDYFEKAGLSYEYFYPPYYGWYFDIDDEGQLFIASVSENSTASVLGLKAGDVVRELMQNKISSDLDQTRNYVQNVESLKVGSDIRFVVDRDGALLELSGKVKSGTQPNVIIKENPNATAKQVLIRRSIVGAK